MVIRSQRLAEKLENPRRPAVGFKRRLHRCQNPSAHGPLPEKNLLTTR